MSLIIIIMAPVDSRGHNILWEGKTMTEKICEYLEMLIGGERNQRSWKTASLLSESPHCQG